MTKKSINQKPQTLLLNLHLIASLIHRDFTNYSGTTLHSDLPKPVKHPQKKTRQHENIRLRWVIFKSSVTPYEMYTEKHAGWLLSRSGTTKHDAYRLTIWFTGGVFGLNNFFQSSVCGLTTLLPSTNTFTKRRVSTNHQAKINSKGYTLEMMRRAVRKCFVAAGFSPSCWDIPPERKQTFASVGPVVSTCQSSGRVNVLD